MEKSAVGKSVVITGANGGIGLATAVELAGRGFDVIGTVRSERGAETVADAAENAGVSVRTVLCDVTDEEQTQAAFEEIAATTDGGPWALVNNAGIAQAGAIEDVSEELARRQVDVNLLAPARLMRLALPAMRARGEGRIVNVSSMSGRVALPFLGWYAASKYGLEAISDAARREVAGFGVKVILIEPGSYGTGVWNTAFSALPEREKSAYQEAYAMVDQIEAGVADMPPPTPVAQTIRRALSSARPRSRYLVGTDAIGAVLLNSLAPTAVSDYAMRLGTGLTKAPKPFDKIVDRVVQQFV
ncbi:SDR family oxidoreductase [Hoyosella subflava]|uniref:Short-chain dehydrogenase/reductase SDR n=1 Tax=Hoyosella subflava (strain DSM 45089 / JCM 17490 / NBRC 109087 / DQS3-9A1) TaxID=443218 RepID=F6EK98_HOYSD|nr:SDR family oxidoreductase [Hoyosella subflava]AEF42639.1 Short-chain dehydrogenase/reductase SDR [Hoyosella subflava DQS3-9A1]